MAGDHSSQWTPLSWAGVGSLGIGMGIWGSSGSLEDTEVPSWEHRELPRRGNPPALPATQGSHSTMEGQGKTLTTDIPQVEAGDDLGGDKKEREFRWHREQGASDVLGPSSCSSGSSSSIRTLDKPRTQIHGVGKAEPTQTIIPNPSGEQSSGKLSTETGGVWMGSCGVSKAAFASWAWMGTIYSRIYIYCS